MSFLSIVLFFVSLGLLVTVHELGHFSMAKLFNVYCHEFSIGFGPAIYTHQKGETKYSIRAIPLGGYVLMQGEQVEDDEAVKRLNIPRERSIVGIPKWKRAIVMAAGIILNFALGFLLFFSNNMFCPQRQYTNQLTITEDSIAHVAGINTGDAITRVTMVTCSQINNSEICTPVSDVVNIETIGDLEVAFTFPDAPKVSTDTLKLTLYYVENGTSEVKHHDFLLTAEKIEDSSNYSWSKIGVGYYYTHFNYTFSEALKKSGQDWVDGTTLIAKTLGGLFVGKNWDQIGGPVSIMTQSSEILNEGFGYYLWMWGLISVNLAIFNLLPFPGLDGWHLLVIVVESLTGKEIPSKIKSIISAIGMILLFGLMIAVTGKDILNLFK